MFKKWLSENKISDFSFSARLFPRAAERPFWQGITNETHIQSAEKYLGYEWPLIRATQFMEFQLSGDRLSQETPHFARRKALLTLLIGELAEYKGRFLPDLCDGIFLVCEETFWGLSAHRGPNGKDRLLPNVANPYIDLYAAETAELISVIYHIMYDELKAYCPELVERIEYELDRRIVSQYITHCDYNWMGRTGKKVNNWNPWILSNILTVFLTAHLRRSTLESGLKKMLEEINSYYSSIPEDGGCDEGSSYWTAAGAKLFAFCDQLYIATDGKINFFDDEKLKRIGQYELKAYIGDCSFVNFADGSSRLPHNNLDYPLYGFGLRTNDMSFCRFAATLKRKQNRDPNVLVCHGSSAKNTLFSLIYTDKIDAQPEFVPEASYVLPDLQVAFMRSGDWYCALKGGHNHESHNHNDVGNLIVYHNIKPVLLDAGCGVYTRFTFSPEHRYKIWTMRSAYHNLPLLNGQEQSFGDTYRADRFTAEGKTASVSFADAYPEEADVLHASREVAVSDTGITLEDHFDFKNGTNTVTEHFLTLLKPQKVDGGISLDGKYLIKTALPYSIEWVDFEGDSKLTKAWDTEGLYRICLCADSQKSTTLTFEIRSIQN